MTKLLTYDFHPSAVLGRSERRCFGGHFAPVIRRGLQRYVSQRQLSAVGVHVLWGKTVRKQRKYVGTNVRGRRRRVKT